MMKLPWNYMNEDDVETWTMLDHEDAAKARFVVDLSRTGKGNFELRVGVYGDHTALANITLPTTDFEVAEQGALEAIEGVFLPMLRRAGIK